MSSDYERQSIHNDTLDKIFALLLSPDPGEAQSALGRLRNTLGRLGVHASEVKIIYGDDLLHRLYSRNIELERRAEKAEGENYFLRKEASKETLRKLDVVRSGKGDGWEQLRAILLTKVSQKRGWKKQVADALKIRPAELKSYEDGLRGVPDDIIERARSMSVLADPPPQIRSRPRREPPSIPPGTRVHNEGPMTATELYLIGLTFNSSDWLSGVGGVAVAKRKTIAGWPKRGVPPSQAALLRKRYHEKLGMQASQTSLEFA